jgi:hypothetical protein
LHTWFQMFLGFNLAMGRTIGKILGRVAGPGSGPKRKRVRLGRFLPKPKPLASLQLDFTEIAGPAPLTSPGCSSRPESTSPAVPERFRFCLLPEMGPAKFQSPSRSASPPRWHRSFWFRCLWLFLLIISLCRAVLVLFWQLRWSLSPLLWGFLSSVLLLPLGQLRWE